MDEYLQSFEGHEASVSCNHHNIFSETQYVPGLDIMKKAF